MAILADTLVASVGVVEEYVQYMNNSLTNCLIESYAYGMMHDMQSAHAARFSKAVRSFHISKMRPWVYQTIRGIVLGRDKVPLIGPIDNPDLPF